LNSPNREQRKNYRCRHPKGIPMTVTLPEELRIVSRRGEPTWEIARAFPCQGDWTEEGYLSVVDLMDGFVELSDGCLEFPPMPSFRHQFIFEYLFDSLRAYLRRTNTPGRAVSPPFPVRLWKGQFRQPDVVFVKSERIASVDRQPDGADFVIEIVSPDEESRERDLDVKHAEYAAAGIPEYWIVDPETRTIHVLTLDGVETGGPYRVHGEFKAGATATSLLLNGFAVAVDECFAAGEGATSDVSVPDGRG
jgi:Uma2 family endonuclease